MMSPFSASSPGIEDIFQLLIMFLCQASEAKFPQSERKSIKISSARSDRHQPGPIGPANTFSFTTTGPGHAMAHVQLLQIEIQILKDALDAYQTTANRYSQLGGHEILPWQDRACRACRECRVVPWPGSTVTWTTRASSVSS